MTLSIQNIQVEHLARSIFTDCLTPKLSYHLISDQPDTKQIAYRVQAGKWDSGRIEMEQIPYITLHGERRPFGIYSVRLTVWDNHGEEATAETVFCSGKLEEPWKGKWITDKSIKTDKKHSPRPFSAMKKFRVNKELKRALICATAVGNYCVTVNEQKITDDMLAPGYTSYPHTLQYQIYDITDFLHEGDNTVEAVVSGGWAVGLYGGPARSCNFAPRQLFKCELRMEYEDGTTEIVATDREWLVSSQGAYRLAGLYEGVEYDARINSRNTAWKKADTATWKYHPQMLCTYGTLAFRQELLKPVEQHMSKRGGIIYDFGQNCAAVVCLNIKGAKSGQKITVRHAEVLMDGEIFTSNLRNADATVHYICTDGDQFYSPELTTMGFRYVRVQGIEPEKLEITAQVVSSAGKPIGGFSCSDDRLNQLQKNIQWGARSNFVDIPTDCPQRDERLGWTGDIAIFSSTATFNFDMSRFFDKWLLDVKNEQVSTGGVPWIIPAGKTFFPPMATAGWGDCASLVPWAEYLKNGDLSLVERQYISVKKLLKAEKSWSRMLSVGDNRYIWKGLFQFGDWLSPGEGMKEWSYKGKWIATAYFYNTAHIAAIFAEKLNLTNEAQNWRELMKKIEEAYRSVFTDGHGRLHEEFQSGYICPIHFGMLGENERQEMGNRLAVLAKKNGWRIDTGFLGTPYLLFALSDTGHVEEAYRVLMNEKCPGWIYAIRMGATTIWERWDAILPDGRINMSLDQAGSKAASSDDYDPEDQSAPSMTSFNHYSYGAVGDWLYRRLAGLEAEEPGWKQFRLAPIPGGGITHTEVFTETPYGKVVAGWKIENSHFTLSVSVPVGTKCRMVLPDGTEELLPSGAHERSCTFAR